jgi:hypothetical protein
VEVVSSQGFAEDCIITEAETKKADLLVMGTKGATGLREAFIGTITAGVIESINIPVLVVPEKAKFTGMNDPAASCEVSIDGIFFSSLTATPQQAARNSFD